MEVATLSEGEAVMASLAFVRVRHLPGAVVARGGAHTFYIIFVEGGMGETICIVGG